MKTSSAKAKGRLFQQWCRDWILALWPTLQPDDVRSCPMGSRGADLIMSPAAQAAVGLAVECKRRKSPAVYADFDQAARHAAKAAHPAEPVVFIRGDRREPLVIIGADFFTRLLSEAGRCDS